jgi:hypothetical protein
MSKELQLMEVKDVQAMAKALSVSGLFPGIQNEQQAFTLMMLCQSEGLHPMKALQRYDIIEGRPGLKAAAMQADFQNLGGKISILKRDSECAQMTFEYKGMDTTITVTYEEMVRTGVAKSRNGIKANWARHPRQMLHARCVSEGVNAVCPQVKVGMLTPEELMDLNEEPETKSSIMYTEEPEHVPESEKNEIPEEEMEQAKAARKLRAAMNKDMQPLTTEEEIRKVCGVYNKAHGKEFWQTFTYHKNQKVETFEDLFNSHIERIQTANGSHTAEAHAEWCNNLGQCDKTEYWQFVSGYNQNEMYQNDNMCFEALRDKAREFGYWDDENSDFIPKTEIVDAPGLEK